MKAHYLKFDKWGDIHSPKNKDCGIWAIKGSSQKVCLFNINHQFFTKINPTFENNYNRPRAEEDIFDYYFKNQFLDEEMKAYFANIIPELKKFIEKLDSKTILTKKQWILIRENSNETEEYIFRNSRELLISRNGIVEKGKFDIIDSKTILLEFGGQSYLFKHAFLDDVFLILKVKGTQNYLFFINEVIHEQLEIPSFDLFVSLLLKKYKIQSPGIGSPNNFSISKSVELKVINKYSITLGRYCEIHISFYDGLSGMIHSNRKQSKFYIYTQGYKFFYLDKESAINGLHYYLLKNKISKENLISREYA